MRQMARGDAQQASKLAIGLRLAIALAMLLALGGVLIAGRPAAAAKAVEWSRFDVNLALQNDGSYHIVERQQIAFQGGPFHGGFRDISLARVQDIRNVTVGEAVGTGTDSYRYVDPSIFTEAPNTYTYQTTSTDVEVRWGFSPTSDASRTFLVGYDVIGNLRVYADNKPPNEQIWWVAVPTGITDTAPVRESTVQIQLPKAVNTSQVVLSPNTGGVSAHTSNGQTWTWTTHNLSSGDSFEVRLQFPPIVNVPPPSWQAADDAQRLHEAQVANKSALYNVIFLIIGLLLAIGGAIGLYGLWYARGRDPYEGAVADFLPKPPDDLPPGAAGTLLDEQADERDLIATLVDLARRGALKMDEVTSGQVLGLGGSRDFKLTLQETSAKLLPFEQSLINALFTEPKIGATTMMSNVKERFVQNESMIKGELYDELVKRGYFPKSPEDVRKYWKTVSIAILVIAGIGGFFIGSVIASTLAAGFIYVPVVVVILLGLALLLLSGKMVRRTEKGAIATAKWRAFRKYLSDIEKYEKLDEAQHIFNQYLPFAIAFGIEDSWVRKFAQVQTPVPTWYGGGGGMWVGPMMGGYGRRGYYGPRGWTGPIIIPPIGGQPGGGQPQGGGGQGQGGGVNLPDLQGTSNAAGQSLQGASNSFMDMLNAAAKAFSSWSSSGGGGGGWGGGGGGFGGGGGSGGGGGGGGGGFH